MRGKDSLADFPAWAGQITPAHAGKRRRSPSTPRRWKDHPRVCGEKSAKLVFPQKTAGSPPRMRGKDRLSTKVVAVIRITPAYAGKSSASCASWGPERDHPRVCGEKHPDAAIGADAVGITPAYAGKSPETLPVLPAFWDHPRVCGEKPHSPQYLTATQGSPPRMRGKGPIASRFSDAAGITPAYAGKRTNSLVSLVMFRDHPRVCGEKRRFVGIELPLQRITPAYAGKRSKMYCHYLRQ